MGLLHRLTSRHAPAVWRAETRLLHRLGRVRPPVAVQWITTAVCDLTCPHCYSHAGRKATGELTADEACRLIVDECVALGCPTLVLAGGEPTLAKAFPAVVEHAHRRGVPWAMHTHGGRCRELRPVLERCPPSMVAVSLDGPRAYHDGFRGRAGSFDAAVEAIAMFREIGVAEVVAGTTLTRQNAPLLPDLLPTLQRCGAHSWGLHLVTPEGRGCEHPEILPTARQLRRVAAMARRLRAVPPAAGGFPVELDNEWGSAGRDDAFYRDGRFACGAGRISCVVSATGEVMPCTTTDPAESQGNVRDTPLSELWARGFVRFRDGRDPLRGDDADCWLQTRHGRSCRGAAFFGRDVIDAPVRLQRITVGGTGPSRDTGRPVGRRGRVLHGQTGRRLVRSVAVAAVALGWAGASGADEPTRAARGAADGPTPAADEVHNELPAVLTPEVVRRWIDWRSGGGWRPERTRELDAECVAPPAPPGPPGRAEFARIRRTGDASDEERVVRAQRFAASVPSPELRRLLLAELEVEPAPAVTVESLRRTLDEMERQGVYNIYLLGLLWRESRRATAAAGDGDGDGADAEAVAGLYRRLHRHARMVDALTLAAAEAPPVALSPRAWMSKAGPGRELERQREAAAEAVVRALPEAWRTAGEGGPWQTQGGVALTWDAEADRPLTLLRGDGGSYQVEPGRPFVMRRLDVLRLPERGGEGEAEAWTLQSSVGPLTGLRAGEVMTAWDLADRLTREAEREVEALVGRVAADPADEEATDRLEEVLPLAHDAIERRVGGDPDAAGAASLRGLLSQFDESLPEASEGDAEDASPQH